MANSSRVEVVSWSDIEAQFAGSGRTGGGGALLLGNGFSTNVWSEFAYRALLDRSELTGTAIELFAGRTNFETVLVELSISQGVVSLAAPTDADLAEHLKQLAEQVRGGLLAAVRKVHPEHRSLFIENTPVGRFGSATGVHAIRERVAGYLPRYSSIFTTNYDLLGYWASVTSEIADLLPGSEVFDLRKAENWACQRASKIYFLHGALHLWRDLQTNAEGKRTAGTTDLLLDVIRQSLDTPERVPLFISEGTSAQKISRIGGSPYLTFCLRQLQGNTRPLTVLGHSLAEADQHICDAIQEHQDRKVAVGVWVGNAPYADEQLTVQAKQLQARLALCSDVVFFNSAEHPLTNPDLRCTVEPA